MYRVASRNEGNVGRVRGGVQQQQQRGVCVGGRKEGGWCRVRVKNMRTR
jgi:hypothetical protein